MATRGRIAFGPAPGPGPSPSPAPAPGPGNNPTPGHLCPACPACPACPTPGVLKPHPHYGPLGPGGLPPIHPTPGVLKPHPHYGPLGPGGLPPLHPTPGTFAFLDACQFSTPFVCTPSQEIAFADMPALTLEGPPHPCVLPATDPAETGCTVTSAGLCGLQGGTPEFHAASCPGGNATLQPRRVLTADGAATSLATLGSSASYVSAPAAPEVPWMYMPQQDPSFTLPYVLGPGGTEKPILGPGGTHHTILGPGGTQKPILGPGGTQRPLIPGVPANGMETAWAYTSSRDPYFGLPYTTQPNDRGQMSPNGNSSFSEPYVQSSQLETANNVPTSLATIGGGGGGRGPVSPFPITPAKPATPSKPAAASSTAPPILAIMFINNTDITIDHVTVVTPQGIAGMPAGAAPSKGKKATLAMSGPWHGVEGMHVTMDGRDKKGVPVTVAGVLATKHMAGGKKTSAQRGAYKLTGQSTLAQAQHPYGHVVEVSMSKA